MSHRNEPVLDSDVLDSLRELGGEEDPELLAEIAGLFLDDTPRRLQVLVSALEEHDPVGVERAAHAIKASAANIGALVLAELLRQVEVAGREANLSKAGPLIRQASHEYERVEQALNAEIA